MRRLAAAGATALMLVLAACEGTETDGVVPTSSPGERPTGSPSSGGSGTPGPTATAMPSATASPSSSPSPEPAIQLPSDAPTSFLADAAPFDLPLDELVPPGAEVDSTWIPNPPEDPSQQIGIVWSRGEDPLFRERGFVLWMPFDDPPRWEVVYAFTDPIARGVLGIRTVSRDLTRDEVADLLTFEDIGGSGACGTWRVIASGDGTATEVFRRRTCDAELATVGDHLELTEAVFEPGDSHCCPSAYRTTTLEWDGERFVRTAVTESPAPQP